MHELAICESLMTQVQDIAHQHSAQRVTSVVIAMGALSGVEADLLRSAYTIARAGTIANGADLVIEELPVIVKCNECGCESDATPNRLVCRSCGDWRTTLVSGDQLLLMNIELEKTENTEAKTPRYKKH